MTVTTERLSIYGLMSDQQLLVAIEDLQIKVEQLGYARSPVASKMRDAYTDALLAARAEMERRRT